MVTAMTSTLARPASARLADTLLLDRLLRAIADDREPQCRWLGDQASEAAIRAYDAGATLSEAVRAGREVIDRVA
jgi:hypothetical protein